MKLFSIIFMALPFLLGGLAWSFRESTTGATIFGFWLVASVLCMCWGFLIRRTHLSLTWGCVAVGIIQFALMFVLPLFVPSKTF